MNPSKLKKLAMFIALVAGGATIASAQTPIDDFGNPVIDDQPSTAPMSFDDGYVPSPSDRIAAPPEIEFAPPTRRSGSAAADAKRIAAEYRIRRARFQANSRMERLENEAWTGRVSGRPAFTAVPMMTSRYGRPVIVIPVYVP